MPTTRSGYGRNMSENPNLDDVLPVTEQATPDHRAHAKTPKHLDDEQLERRTEQERLDTGSEDAPSGGA